MWNVKKRLLALTELIKLSASYFSQKDGCIKFFNDYQYVFIFKSLDSRIETIKHGDFLAIKWQKKTSNRYVEDLLQS